MRRPGALGVGGWLLALASACGVSPANGPDQVNRLAGKTLTASGGAENPERIADGVLAPVGDFWKTGLTAILPSPESAITIDLGAELPIAAAWIQGDNNDRYLLSGSIDGTIWKQIWEAPPVRGAGMRARKADGLGGRARYLRLSAAGGDGAYSVSELQVFSVAPGSWPEPPGGRGTDEKSPHTQWILLFGLACGAFLVLGCHGSIRRAAVTALLPIVAGILMASDLWGGQHNFTDQDVSMLRSMLGAIGLAAVLRPFVLRRMGGVVDGRRITALLGVAALLAVACFFNLGRAQFWDAKQRQTSFIHNYDMRVYFPVAKYFHELKYDGLYLASVAAYIENTPGASVQSLADVELRDLRTHEMRRVREVADQIQNVHQRFSPARWDDFKRDMRYFHETMGRDYFVTLTDHGGNATPVWLTVAHFMFAFTHASNGLLFATALLDPLLILLFAFFAARTFGLRTAFVCLIVFGANDLYMFGTDWAGSTLRNDWMAALGLGVCALKVRRWYLGGALLAYAGMIRAFPGIAVLGLLVPPIWWVFDVRRADDEWPTLRETLREHEGTVRALLGAAAAVVVMFLVSSAVLSPSAWIGWLKKAFVLASGYHVNHVSLQSIMSTDYETWEMAERWRQSVGRMAVYILSIIVFSLLVLRAARNRRPHQAAVVALFLIPVVFNAANYYFHYVFMLPLLAVANGEDRHDARMWGPLLAMCVAEYAATVAPTLSQHFVTESICLMSTFLVMLIWLNREPEARGEVVEPEEEAGAEAAPEVA
ncbi:MAG TPA: hypothetical protein VFH68_23870 [Polyangia bacterium]|nr:hypothetical protein [Polyangia bacterium]